MKYICVEIPELDTVIRKSSESLRTSDAECDDVIQIHVHVLLEYQDGTLSRNVIKLFDRPHAT